MAAIKFDTDLESVKEHIQLAIDEEIEIDLYINDIDIKSIDFSKLHMFEDNELVTLIMEGDPDYLIDYLTAYQDQGGFENLKDVHVKGLRVGYELNDSQVVWFEPQNDDGSFSEDFIDLADVIIDMVNSKIKSNLVFEDPHKNSDDESEEEQEN